MLSQSDGPFINLARLNIGKYSQQPGVAKALFEYIFYHENSIREAMDLAAQSLQATKWDLYQVYLFRKYLQIYNFTLHLWSLIFWF